MTGRHGWPGILAAAAAAVVVALLSASRLSSVDLGYHLAYGRQMLDTRRIVDRDPFIYGATDHRFVNANWGSQVIFAALDRWGGPTALSVLQIGLIVATFAFGSRAGRAAGASWTGLAVFGLIAALAAYERFSLRPELFSFLLLAALTCVLVAAPRRLWIACAAVAIIQIVWVNVHSYFIVGPLLVGGLLVGESIRGLVRRGTPVPAGSYPPSCIALLLAVQCVACLANPRGFEGAVFPLRTLGFLSEQGVSAGGPDGAFGGGPWSTISEFHSPLNYLGYSVNHRTINAYVALLIAATVGALAALRIGRWGWAVVILMLVLMSLRMRRNIAPFAIGAAPLIAGALAAWVRTFPLSTRAVGRGRWAATVIVLAVGVWWTPRIASGRFYVDERRLNRSAGPGWAPRVFPVEACAWLAAQSELQPRLFTDFFTSSNALPFLPPRWQVFITTNTFAYPPAALDECQKVCLGAMAHKPFLDGHGVNVILLHAANDTEGLIRSLHADAEWGLVWFDEAFVIFVRRMPAHEPVIARAVAAPLALDVGAWIIAADRNRATAGFDLGQLAAVPMLLSSNDAAERLLARAVELEPDYLEAWQNLGYVRVMKAKEAVRGNQPPNVILRLMNSAVPCFSRVVRSDADPALKRAAAHNLAQLEETIRAARSLRAE